MSYFDFCFITTLKLINFSLSPIDVIWNNTPSWPTYLYADTDSGSPWG